MWKPKTGEAAFSPFLIIRSRPTGASHARGHGLLWQLTEPNRVRRTRQLLRKESLLECANARFTLISPDIGGTISLFTSTQIVTEELKPKLSDSVVGISTSLGASCHFER
jgi:hypothetical protein